MRPLEPDGGGDDPRQVWRTSHLAHTASFGGVSTPDEVTRTRNDLWIQMFLNTGNRGAD